MKFNGQTAIITGAASGIGQATAVQLGKQGAQVVLVDLQPCTDTIAQLKELANEPTYLEVLGDIREKTFVQSVVDQTIEQFNEIHILVNNAGTCGRVGLDELTEEIWDRDLDTNVKAAYLFIQAVVYPHMKEKQYGRIVNISSVSGINGGVISNIDGLTSGRSGPAYAASKGAMIALSNWTAKELGQYGITSNCVAPGATETGLTTGMKYDLSGQVIKRIGTPQDIAEAVCYLASPNTGYTTGHTLKVDGGVHIG